MKMWFTDMSKSIFHFYKFYASHQFKSYPSAMWMKHENTLPDFGIFLISARFQVNFLQTVKAETRESCIVISQNCTMKTKFLKAATSRLVSTCSNIYTCFSMLYEVNTVLSRSFSRHPDWCSIIQTCFSMFWISGLFCSVQTVT